MGAGKKRYANTIKPWILAVQKAHEGDEARVYHREGEAGTVRCLPRHQDEDVERPDEERPHEELLREDREQEGECRWQEALREHHQALDPCGPEGPEGAEPEGPRAGEREERA